MATTLEMSKVAKLLNSNLKEELNAAKKITVAAASIMKQSAREPEEPKKPKTSKEKYSAKKAKKTRRTLLLTSIKPVTQPHRTILNPASVGFSLWR